MEYLLLLFALLLCAAVLSLRASKPLEAEGESASSGCLDRVVLGGGLDEPIDYTAGVYESIQARRLSTAEASGSRRDSQTTALISVKKLVVPRPSVAEYAQAPEVKCTAVRQRVTYYRLDGSVGSTHDTEVLQFLKPRS